MTELSALIKRNTKLFFKDKGMFICSGIIAERLDDVTEALDRNGFEVLEITRRKDWCAIASRLK